MGDTRECLESWFEQKIDRGGSNLEHRSLVLEVGSEQWSDAPYLTRYLSCLAESTHQCTTRGMDDVNFVRFFFLSYPRHPEPEGAKFCKFPQRLTELILYLSQTPKVFGTINTAHSKNILGDSGQMSEREKHGKLGWF